MLFKAELCDLILAGRKTMTRRIVRPDDCTPSEWKAAAGDPVPVEIAWADGERVNAVIANGPRLRYGVGKTYAVQPGRGKRGVGYISITEIRHCARAGDLSHEDAIAEGFADAEEFRAVYQRLNGTAALERACWALTFTLVSPEGT